MFFAADVLALCDEARGDGRLPHNDGIPRAMFRLRSQPCCTLSVADKLLVGEYAGPDLMARLVEIRAPD